MNLPINGRIAIIDDQLQHAEPLMKVLSSRQLPFTYFSGEVNFLPAENATKNDIRLLFLDINLIDNSEHENKVLKGSLLPVLKRVISEDNYPYVIIYWSRHDKHHKNLLETEIFGQELKDRKPIAYMSAMKSDFFNLDGTETNDIEYKIDNLFNKIDMLMKKLPAYNYLLNWENKIHISADKTLENVFSSYHKYGNWSDNANYIISKLGKSFSGKLFESQNAENRIKSSYNALNIIFDDTLEKRINNDTINNSKKLKVSTTAKNLDTIYSINKKLLTSEEIHPIHYSGSVLEILDKKVDFDFENLLNTCLKNKEKKAEIIKAWKKIWINVTPLCDTVQGKIIFHRIVRGLLIKNDFKDLSKIFYSSEAIFISPAFTIEKDTYFILLDFREFFTLNTLGKSKNRKPLFRIRQQLLAEIQSKLARHISRQGVLFLDE